MTAMNPLVENSLDTIHTWHRQQQPVVQALATPMVEQIATLLTGLDAFLKAQGAVITEYRSHAEEGNVRLKTLYERIKTLERDLVTVQSVQETSPASQALIDDLTAKLEVTTDRIGVLERQIFGRASEKAKRARKTPDGKREAHSRRRNELTAEEKEQRRQAAAAKRQAQLDKLRTVNRTEPMTEAFASGRQMPPST